LISNRQGGRRRGRGGQRGQNLGGNRQDNRQRGNAAQLLEKYKNMARDAQLAGDRVQSEYYLQYADHYFRVLGENRARFEEHRRQRGDDAPEEEEGEEEMVEASDQDRGDDDGRRRRSDSRDGSRRNGAPQADTDSETEDERIAVEALPPAIGREVDEVEDEAPKPRRRARRPRSDDGEAEIAPAA
jgi:hypothetical protein